MNSVTIRVKGGETMWYPRKTERPDDNTIRMAKSDWSEKVVQMVTQKYPIFKTINIVFDESKETTADLETDDEYYLENRFAIERDIERSLTWFIPNPRDGYSGIYQAWYDCGFREVGPGDWKSLKTIAQEQAESAERISGTT